MQIMLEKHPNLNVLGHYYTAESKMVCQCKLDGFQWVVRAKNLIAGHGCKQCQKRKQHWRTPEEFIKEMHQYYPDIEPLSQFSGNAGKVHFRCKVCGYEWDAVANGFMIRHSKGCPKCLHRARVTENELRERITKMNTTILYLDSYTDMSHKARFMCKSCNYVWSALPGNILSRGTCPHCKISLGEKTIENYLINHHITYLREYKFPECKNKRPLPFDFYLPDYNLCIEYDGEQHFQPVTFHKYTLEQAERKLRYVQQNDTIKNEFCKTRDIKLLRIPYTEFKNIDDILHTNIL